MRTIRVRALIEHDGLYLFVKHVKSRHNTRSNWVLPGGGLEDGETIVEGIRREIIEELGIEPIVGRIKYVQQLFFAEDESLEFFFEVLNGADFGQITLEQTSHGLEELLETRFIDPAKEAVLPSFLADIKQHEVEGDWPKFYFARYPEL